MDFDFVCMISVDIVFSANQELAEDWKVSVAFTVDIEHRFANNDVQQESTRFLNDRLRPPVIE